MKSKNILVAPLNWGLGHATRCIPIINALLENGFNPIIASDGNALALLKKEFPKLIALELPSYEIEYAKKSKNFKWKLLKNSPKTINAIYKEKKLAKIWVVEYNLIGIISDNRLGLHCKKVPSIFITHQLTVLSGKTTWISSKMHQYFIKKFVECWVPDVNEKPNLSGKLGHLKNSSLNIKYIGVLSRLKKVALPKKYDLMVLLSGPEPQRSILEEKIHSQLEKFDGKIVFIKGRIEAKQTVIEAGNTTFYNYMQTEELEKNFNESDLVLCRSGYTTLMDLAKLQKKAFFIPTPGQTEQEYLAKRMKNSNVLPMSKQENFKMEDLNAVSLYKGFSVFETELDWENLFKIFT